ncbi:MAG: hypothetical protein KatS3mg087_1975 [Patescibacteria group bacterium]|nr:MAG: hypothetical protein KatS3mg087_1975 [Patescibacteria group bacterium]
MMIKNLLLKLILILLTFQTHAQTLVPYNCGDKWGYADETGKLVLPCRYDAISRFINGRTVVEKNGKDMLIDAKGKVILEEGSGYEEIVWGDENYLIARTVGEGGTGFYSCEDS